ncbi:hypothetical protein Tco_1162504, partial [Tanacetum coccineum]
NMAKENVPVKACFPIGKSNLLMDLQKIALVITPKDYAHPFVPPPAGDLSISAMENYSFHINQCLTRKTSGGDIPRHPVLQIMWGVVTGTNVDYAELI